MGSDQSVSQSVRDRIGLLSDLSNPSPYCLCGGVRCGKCLQDPERSFWCCAMEWSLAQWQSGEEIAYLHSNFLVLVGTTYIWHILHTQCLWLFMVRGSFSPLPRSGTDRNRHDFPGSDPGMHAWVTPTFPALWRMVIWLLLFFFLFYFLLPYTCTSL